MTLLYRTAFFASLAAVTTLAFLPDYDTLPAIASVSDLANHAAAFAVLFLLHFLSYPHHGRGRIVLALLSYGVFIEAVQSLLPTRYASLEDIAADTAGIIIGLGAVKTVEKIRRGAPEEAGKLKEA